MIKTEDLFVRFSDGSGIRYRDMRFDTGRSYALLGASGVGKSTFLNLIAGVLTPAEGRVTVDGEAVSALPQRARDLYRIRRVGYIFQDFKLLEDMTVQDNINILRLEGVDTSQMAALLDRLGLLRLKKRRVNRLSGGEHHRERRHDQLGSAGGHALEGEAKHADAPPLRGPIRPRRSCRRARRTWGPAGHRGSRRSACRPPRWQAGS